MSHHLITTAHEHSWKFDRPVLFLGEWCRIYDRQSVWGGMDAIVAEPYGLQEGRKELDIAYIQSLSGQLLKELVLALNSFHGTHHSLRYWHIVLGHWLNRYVSIVFNRYFTLEQALNRYDVSGTTIFDSSEYSLATTDSLALISASNDDIWNHVLYSRILNFLGGIKTELDADAIKGVPRFSRVKKSNPDRKTGAKRLVLNACNKILERLGSNEDAFIINSYLPFKVEVKLQLGLGQWPKRWKSPPLQTVPPNPVQRKRVQLEGGGHEGFESFVRTHLAEMIPTCFLEGYAQLIEQSGNLSWPSRPRFVFTSNNFDSDEIFKVWVGQKVEEGVPYFTGQHGNNYGTLLGSNNWPELVTCDKFFTWGWSTGYARNIPAFVFKTAGQKKLGMKSDGGLLLIELHAPLRLGPEDDYFDFGIYQEGQFRFVEALPDHISEKVTVRLHCYHSVFRWFDVQRWRDRLPLAGIESGAVPVQQLIEKSRLVVYSYDSTGILEALALNMPMICFWHGGLDHLLSDAKPYYELLKNAGILHDTPESAAMKVMEIWNHVGLWWGSTQVQGARKLFSERYARQEEKPAKTLKRLLTMGLD